MLISIINLTRSLPDAEVVRAIRAINRQFSEDFEPYWQFGARLRLDGGRSGRGMRPATPARLDGRHGDGVIYLVDSPTLDDAEGYHDRGDADFPFGFVFLDVCKEIGDEWTVALSHEAIEMVADPLNNLLVQGPHPADRRHSVFHMFELCDAVQSETYELEGTLVSNFLLPGYFTQGEVSSSRNDFLGHHKRGHALPAFGIAPGGFICFYDGRLKGDNKWHPFARQEDAAAMKRLDVKILLARGRVARRRAPAPNAAASA